MGNAWSLLVHLALAGLSLDELVLKETKSQNDHEHM